jgi:hypothetical protein
MTKTETGFGHFRKQFPGGSIPRLGRRAKLLLTTRAAMAAEKEDKMLEYCRDAYHAQLLSQYEAGWETVERHPSPERQIPLRWLTWSIVVLSAISLGLGLALKWLFQ